MAKPGNQALKIVDGKLVFPTKPRRFVRVRLYGRALEVLKGAKLGSITITPTAIYISYSRMVKVKEPKGWIAIDVNEDNVTAISSEREVKVFDVSKLKKAGYGYFERRRRLQRRYHKDRKVLKKALSKLSKNYRNKVSTMLHQVSTAIVEWCKEKGCGLIHENLKGLRNIMNKKGKRFNKFNGKVQQISKCPKKLKRRLNNWWFWKFLNQIEYKALWDGIKTIESQHTRGSSSTCPICGDKLKKYPNGLVKCEKHGLMNRHVVACLNLLRWEGVVRLQPPLECSREPSPNKPHGDEEKLGKQKRGSCVSKMQNSRCNGLSITRHPQTQQSR